VEVPGKPACLETGEEFLGIETIRRFYETVTISGCRLDPVAEGAERLHVLPDLGA
jgi:hypothetical protein